jgi:hypothetical protein
MPKPIGIRGRYQLSRKKKNFPDGQISTVGKWMTSTEQHVGEIIFYWFW